MVIVVDLEHPICFGIKNVCSDSVDSLCFNSRPTISLIHSTAWLGLAVKDPCEIHHFRSFTVRVTVSHRNVHAGHLGKYCQNSLILFKKKKKKEVTPPPVLMLQFLPFSECKLTFAVGHLRACLRFVTCLSDNRKETCLTEQVSASSCRDYLMFIRPHK